MPEMVERDKRKKKEEEEESNGLTKNNKYLRDE